MSGRPYVETLVFVGGVSVDVRAWVREHPDADREVSWGEQGHMRPGGRAASAAVATTRLGRKFVDLVGCAGDDMLGDSIISSLKTEGVSVRLLDRASGTPTGIRQVVVDSKGERRTVGVPNANWHCGEAQVRKADSTIFGADLVYATLEVPSPTITRVIKTAAARNVPVLLDATPVPTPAGEAALGSSLLTNVDVLLTNYPAAAQITEVPSLSGPVAVEMAKRLLRLGPKAVVITLGEHGSLVAVRGKHALVDTGSARAVDTTSGGDAFGGALAVGLTNQARGNWNWDQLLYAVKYASAAATICVSRFGGQEALPSKAEVERQLATMR